MNTPSSCVPHNSVQLIQLFAVLRNNTGHCCEWHSARNKTQILQNQQYVWLLQIARVTLLDPQGAKRDYLASVVGLLRSKDLVVLKIEAPASILQPAVIGTSADVRVGQQVLAIGNPFGFDHTLTTGAVSGLDRVIQSQVGATSRTVVFIVLYTKSSSIFTSAFWAFVPALEIMLVGPVKKTVIKGTAAA